MIQGQVSGMPNAMLLTTILCFFGAPLLPDINQANEVHACFEIIIQ